MYYGCIGCIITVVVGYLVSMVTSFKEEELYDEKLIHPIARKVASFFPGQKRRYADKCLNRSNSYSITTSTPTTPMTTTTTSTSLSTAAAPFAITDSKNLTSYSQDVCLEETETYNTKL